jgi:FMN phosphatase YigB (HAD superfamily)
MKALRAVLFDYGGTLTTLTVSLEDLRVKCLRNIQSFLEGHGVTVAMAQLEVADEDAWGSFRMQGSLGEVDAAMFMTRFLRRSGVNVSEGDVIVAEAMEVDYMTAVPFIELLPETLPTLRVLREHQWKMGVVSNNVFPEMLRASVERLGLGSFFDVIVASGDLGVRKPAAAIFQRALSGLACGVEETMFVGDSLEEDIGGAKKLGMTSVWLHSSADVSGGSIVPDYEVESLSAILQILGLRG